MKAELRQKAIELRTRENLSYGEIQKLLSVPKSTLSYWLKDFTLSESKILELRKKGWEKGEASREKFRETMKKKREEHLLEIYKKQQRQFIKVSKNALFLAGLMLYLGEGDKKSNGRIGLANTDPRIIRFFIKWMNNFLKISKDKVKIQLHLYENMNIEKEKKFWQNKTGLAREQFCRPSVRKVKIGSFSYEESFRHGTCSLYIDNVVKKSEIAMAIKAFADKYM